MRKHLLVIENPASGQGQNDLSLLRHEVHERGWELSERKLDGAYDLKGLLADAGRFDAVVGIGGDGTISGIASQLSGTEIPLLAWPGGTGNLVAQNMFLDLNPQTLCQALFDWNLCRIDMGELSAGSERIRFLMLAGAGTDARMIQESEDLKADWGLASYAAALLKQFDHAPSQIELRIDQQLIHEDSAVGVMVANMGRINFRLPLGEQISAQDQLLDVIVIRKLSPALLVTEFWNALGRQLGAETAYHSDIGVYQGRQVELRAEPALPLEYDGESLQLTTPVSFRILPEALVVFGQQQALA